MAIIVHYSVEATALGADGEELETRSSNNVKRIKLTSLTEHTDVAYLAREIVDKCELIHESKLGEVERLCRQLQARYGDRSSYHHQQQQLTTMKETSLSGGAGAGKPGAAPTGGKANLRKLDEYIEMLYEDVSVRTNATALILELVTSDANTIETLVGQERLMLALTRVLKEDLGKKGTEELVANIAQFFFVVSQYSQFHGVIQQYQVGRSALRIAELETERHAVWLAALREKERAAAESANDPAAQAELERQLRSTRSKEQKQERLLFVSVHLLLNIAENPSVEKKLCNKNVTGVLVSMLERRNLELLILVATFLRKLSIYKENKEALKSLRVVEKLAMLLGARNAMLVSAIVELLINLAFDRAIREDMIKFGLVSQLAELLGDNEHSSLALKLLYLLSTDEASRPAFAYGGAVHKLRDLILEADEQHVRMELIAVAINLGLCERTAVLFCENGGLDLFVRRVCATGDPLLMKFIHNISLHPGDFKLMFLDHIEQIVALIKDSPSPEFQLEALALLAGLKIDRFNYAKLLDEFSLLECIFPMLQPDAYPDDIALQAVVLIGTVACDAAACELIARTHVIETLMDLMSAKQEDDAFVLNVTYAFYFFAMCPATRDVLLGQANIVVYLLDLLPDKNVHVRRLAATLLDMVVEHDPQSEELIKRRKFEAHNAEWLEIVEAEAAGGDGAAAGAQRHQYHDNEDTVGHGNLSEHRSFDNVHLHSADMYNDDGLMDTVDSVGLDGGSEALYL